MRCTHFLLLLLLNFHFCFLFFFFRKDFFFSNIRLLVQSISHLLICHKLCWDLLRHVQTRFGVLNFARYDFRLQSLGYRLYVTIKLVTMFTEDYCILIQNTLKILVSENYNHLSSGLTESFIIATVFLLFLLTQPFIYLDSSNTIFVLFCNQ